MTRHFIGFLVAIGMATVPAHGQEVMPQQLQQHYYEMLDQAAAAVRRIDTSVTGNPGAPGLSRDQVGQAIDRASRNAQTGGVNPSDAVERAYVRHNQAPIQNTAPAAAARAAREMAADAVDPAEIVRLYRNVSAADPMANGPKDQLVVFVSTSLPDETLRVIGAQAKRYGAVLVLRGVAGGFSGRNLQNTVRALKPATDQGADVQIHPELFRKYGVTAVPTTVLAAMADKACDDGVCTNHVSLVGDVSIEYALEQFARRSDELGRIAQARLQAVGSAR